MRRPPLLLQLLVSLALFLNGIGSAQAASGLEPQHPCHESATTAPHTHPALAAVPHQSSTHSDCCKSANCHCGCVNHVQLASMTTLVLLANITHACPPRALQLGHAAAALPHLIRPPISQA